MKLTSFTNFVFFFVSIRLFTDGMEDFLIQPTAWYYARYLGQSNVYLGFLIAAFNIGALVFSPCIGALDTKFKISKLLLIMGALTKFIGYLLYTIPVNEYVPLTGRFLSGIADGTAGILYGATTRATNNINRPLAFLFFEGLYSFGTSCGPVAGSVLTFEVNILGWKINPGNSPGLILTIVWFLLLILSMFIPNDLAENKLEDRKRSEESDSEETIADDTKAYSISRIGCLYFIIAQSWFILSLGLFYTPLLAANQLGLGLLEIKLIYLNAALFSFVIFLTCFLLSSHISEKQFLAIGIVSWIVPLSILFSFALFWDNIQPVHGAYLLTIFTASVSISNIIFPLASSLLSKETPVKKASLYQSISFAALNATGIAGRVIGGATFNRTAMTYVGVGLTICWLILLLWFAIEYHKMFPESGKRKKSGIRK